MWSSTFVNITTRNMLPKERYFRISKESFLYGLDLRKRIFWNSCNYCFEIKLWNKNKWYLSIFEVECTALKTAFVVYTFFVVVKKDQTFRNRYGVRKHYKYHVDFFFFSCLFWGKLVWGFPLLNYSLLSGTGIKTVASHKCHGIINTQQLNCLLKGAYWG